MSCVIGNRGVFFTFLTFLLIGIILVMVGFHLGFTERATQTTIEISVLNAINAKYDDITDDIVTLDHPIGVPSIAQRIIPFNHVIDHNHVVITQQLPVPTGKLNLYYDVINAYRIFVQDQNTQHTFDGVNVDLNTPRNTIWGGTSAGARFNILPQCLQYQILDDNRVAAENNSFIGCQNSFDLIGAVERIDINVSLLSGVDDFNVVSCDFNGNICPHDAYSSDANLPYFTLTFLDANCSDCALTAADKSISGHFDLDWQTIQYSCAGANCTSTPLTIQIGEGVRAEHGLTPSQIIFHIQFRAPISTFYYQDVNYLISKTGFDTVKSNAVVFPT